MQNQTQKLKLAMIRVAVSAGSFLAVIFLVNCAAAWQPPNSWTLRGDGRIRASQRKEDFSTEEFIAKIAKEEGKSFAWVVTPAGQDEISRELRRRDAKIIELQNALNECNRH